MSKQPKNPTNWDDYQYGTSHRSSVSSATGRSVRFSQDHDRDVSPSARGEEDGEERDQVTRGLRHRRSSVGAHLNALAHLGGVNSIENFARSWSRAAGFHEVAPIRPSFLLTSEGPQEEETAYLRSDVEGQRLPQTSLLRQHLEASPPANENAVEDWDEGETPGQQDAADKHTRLGSDLNSVRGSTMGSVAGARYSSVQGSIRAQSSSIFAAAPHLATPLIGSYGTSYGTLRSTLNESSMRHAGDLWRDQQETGASAPDGERAPLLVKEVEQDGEIILVVEGQSTLPQTVFNSTNTLIGVGLLSLPLGIRYAGWICGLGFLSWAAVVTNYTAKLLAKCMDADKRLVTFADLAFISYGPNARYATGVLFTLELLAATVALVILFADTLNLLIPGVGVLEWKLLCGLLLIPLQFLPLRLLSFTSVLGIVSTLSIVLIVFIDGFIKPNAPGSLREPSPTYRFPANWLTLPLSFGLLMSPWGAHSVFPSFYRDMRHPYKWQRAMKYTFSFTYFLDTLTAVAGLLMFGDGVMDEITSNLIGNSDYPKALTVVLCAFIAIIPLTKAPLNTRPIISTIEIITGLDNRAVSDTAGMVGLSAWTRGILKIVVRVGLVILLVVISILFPAFDSIMAFMGSALVFSVSVIMPLLFHVRIFAKELSKKELFINYALIAVSTVLALVGTVWAFLPKTLLGLE